MDQTRIEYDLVYRKALEAAELSLAESHPGPGKPLRRPVDKLVRTVSISILRFHSGALAQRLTLWDPEPWRLRTINLCDVPPTEVDFPRCELERLNYAVHSLVHDDEALRFLH